MAADQAKSEAKVLAKDILMWEIGKKMLETVQIRLERFTSLGKKYSSIVQYGSVRYGIVMYSVVSYCVVLYCSVVSRVEEGIVTLFSFCSDQLDRF